MHGVHIGSGVLQEVPDQGRDGVGHRRRRCWRPPPLSWPLPWRPPAPSSVPLPGSAGRSDPLKVEPDTEPDADPDGVEQEVPGSAHSNDGSEVPSPEVTQPLELDRPFG